ncbi:hypothetical protein Q5741_03775 [Paenibacillus sp. JX-17]|uniref:Fibronectin type-III domain-containing protein n=1 Tax=Paenibacillus lacisoli TaxID=3064525 RepID=A0ABT9CAF4_9BACL|nr:hypothetical protein [Paenibacillus sp. JX-17]MDO7905528.1 hypothetical protein [Paenibacillus sp. JX-17]
MKSKKIGILIVTFALLWILTPSHSAFAANTYKGGLLDGLTLQKGTSIGSPAAVGTTLLTDDDAATSEVVQSNNFIWYSFSAPQKISAVMLRKSGVGTIEFYDATNALLLSYTPVGNDTMESLPQALDNVTTVVLKGNSIRVYEWNVYTTPSAPPSPTAINWIQAGDQVVNLEWNTIAAKSYTVKRAVSSGGPYTVIASSVTSVNYQDTNVNNGTTYYYVVSTNNEFGESANSPEKSIKPSSTKYTNGLLDAVALKVGKNIKDGSDSTKLLTDNDVSSVSSLLIVAGNNNNIVWHQFEKPQNISSVIVNKSGINNATIEFYNAKDLLLMSYSTVTSDGVESLPQQVKDVTTVVLRTQSSVKVYEWNLFGTSTNPPNTTAISWIQGGDKIVNLEWKSTGAKSYNIKRASSSGGPYATIATGVTGTEYKDKKVVNGTTYYYVVSSVNEAGESGNSAEKSMAPSATKFTGGLLDGLTLQSGSAYPNATGTVRELTDNSVATSAMIRPTFMVWYTFSSPKEITSVVAAESNIAQDSTIEFYDDKNELLLRYTTMTLDSIETLPVPVANVKTVVLKSSTGIGRVYEWNVFGAGVEQPTEELTLSAAGSEQKVILDWNLISQASNYVIKRGTTVGGPYKEVAAVSGTTATYTDFSVANGTTYYYVVTAVIGTSTLASSNEASATPKASAGEEPNPNNPTTPPVDENSGDRAILSIMLNTGEVKEYDLSMGEVNAFINWYEQRADGTGRITFAIDKHSNNKGPFKNRKDYIIFDKIITFEVNAYDALNNNY